MIRNAKHILILEMFVNYDKKCNFSMIFVYSILDNEIDHLRGCLFIFVSNFNRLLQIIKWEMFESMLHFH